jgi:hypothetical protein
MTTRRALAIGIALAVACLVAVAGPRDDAGAGGSRRYAEAVVVPGSDLAVFAGALPEELWVWAWVDGRWELLVSQLDERLPGGDYVAAEDGSLDEDDELVFPMPLSSAPAPDGQWPPGMDRDAPWVRVRVVDPLQAGVEQTVYVVLSRGGPEIALPPQVRWDADALELRSASYVLGFASAEADGFVGFKRLSLYADETDLIDRLKLRVTLAVPGFGEQEVTEETLALLGVDVGALTPDPAIVGPVRVVIAADGSAMAYADRIVFRLSLLEGMPPLPGLQLTSSRVSLDLSEDGVPARYADANVPAGVDVDGEPDSVPSRPLPAWRELTFTEGHVSLLREGADGAGGASLYYVDDADGVADDTGDGRSFGDQGVAADELDDVIAADFPGHVVISPADMGDVGARLAENLAAPVSVRIEIGNAPPTATASATVPTAAVTATGTPTGGGGPTRPRPTEATPTLSPPVPTPSIGATLFLPLAARLR